MRAPLWAATRVRRVHLTSLLVCGPWPSTRLAVFVESGVLLAGFADLVSRLSHDRHLKGRQFERVCCWYLENDPILQHQLRKVWLWKDWPDRWGADAGIDLVAETHTGELWAVQAKAYAPSASVTKADIDTFLSESSRPQFAMRLLVATTDHISHNARRTIGAQEKPVRVVTATELGKAALEWPEHPDDLRARPLPRKKPRLHQRAAIKDVLKGFEVCVRGQLIMACGTGKTMVSLWVWEALDAQTALVVLPSISLLAQTVREWCANARATFGFLAVCSDESVTDSDLILRSPSELPFATTTDPAQVATFLSSSSQPRRVIFSTYHSTPRVAEALALDGRRIDLVVADEAHRCAGRVGGGFASVLKDESIPAARRLFMTATPRYLAPWLTKVAGEQDVEVVSMDDEAVFGPVFHKLTFGQAIADDLLTDYQVAIIGVEGRQYQEMAEQAALVQQDGGKVTDARTLAAQAALLKGIAKYDLRRCVTFHSRVARARQFADSLDDVADSLPVEEQPSGHLWADHVSGAMASSSRDVRLNRLRTLDDCDRGLLANARCLAEGVDVPALDAVAFIDPRGSQVDIVQAVGRVIRKAPDKRRGVVVLPVFIGARDNAAEAVNGSAFASIWRIMNALRAHDDVLAEELDALRTQLGRHGEAGRPAKIRLDVPASLGSEFFRAFNIRLIEETTPSWFASYGILQGFAEREGHTRVPRHQQESGLSLGSWVHSQRRLFSRGQLSPERVALLESLPGWSWDAFADKWDRNVAALTRFVEREGHSRVPRYQRESGLALGAWVQTRRDDYRAGQLPKERALLLESLPGWSWDPFADKWHRFFAALARFAEREGHTRLPQRHEESSLALSTWAQNQRNLFSRGQLSPERIVLLESLPGWSWDPKGEQWDRNVAALTRFVEREGHALVPADHAQEGFKLGGWVATQRTAFSRGEMRAERAARLEGVPGWSWGPGEDRWGRYLATLRRFIGREGHAMVPQRHTESGLALGAWVSSQRGKFSKGTLPADRISSLEALPGWVWDVHGDRWRRMFALLGQFVRREGHARVPAKYMEGDIALGQWVSVQRRAFRRGLLAAEQTALLETVPGWVWLVREANANAEEGDGVE